jgi:predicted amidohydrolase
MRIGYIQNFPIFGAKKENFHKIESLLDGIKADIIVLPELFATGYAFTSKEELSELSETVDDKTSRFLCNKSLETGSIIIAGFAEKEGNIFFNSSVIIYAGKVEGVYRKLHLFNKEKLFFTPGNYPLKVYKLNGMHVGVMICFDWIFPEVCRVLALEGAQVIAHPSNLVMPFCQQAMITRCLENRIFAITANRIGTELRGDDEYKFTGGSQITSYNGTILSSASIDTSCIDFVEVDVTLADNKMINPFNDVLADRKTAYYNNIIKLENIQK